MFGYMYDKAVGLKNAVFGKVTKAETSARHQLSVHNRFTGEPTREIREGVAGAVNAVVKGVPKLGRQIAVGIPTGILAISSTIVAGIVATVGAKVPALINSGTERAVDSIGDKISRAVRGILGLGATPSTT